MTPDDRFTQLLDDLKMMGVTQNPFFGRRGLVADGKVIACFLDDSVAFKLGRSTEALSRALELSGNKIVPFKDWVRVPDTHQDEWGRLAEQALHHIRETL
jgi:hypothetical protein